MNEHNPSDKSTAEFEKRLDELKIHTNLITEDLINNRGIMRFQTYRAGKIASDVAWIGALQKIGISYETILEIWNIKDEKVRKIDGNPDLA